MEVRVYGGLIHLLVILVLSVQATSAGATGEYDTSRLAPYDASSRSANFVPHTTKGMDRSTVATPVPFAHTRYNKTASEIASCCLYPTPVGLNSIDMMEPYIEMLRAIPSSAIRATEYFLQRSLER
jgi:hypothetical protein